MNITELLEGESAVINSCEHNRLMEHGFVRDTSIEIYKKFSNITCVYIRGALIACRNSDLESITVDYKTK